MRRYIINPGAICHVVVQDGIRNDFILIESVKCIAPWSFSEDEIILGHKNAIVFRVKVGDEVRLRGYKVEYFDVAKRDVQESH